MNHSELQKEILSCIWSRTLKESLANSGHSFTERELLGIAWHFAPDYEERIRLLGLLVSYAPSVSEQAELVIQWQKKLWADFCREVPGEIFELCIKDPPDSYEERYLCANVPACMEMIEQFYQEYDFTIRSAEAQITILKRKILRSGDPFREDETGSCRLGWNNMLLDVTTEERCTEFGPYSPDSCAPENCVRDIEVCFPPFFSGTTPVRYRMPDGLVHYGLHMPFREASETCYVIPLDGEMMNSRDYEAHWGYHWHEHICCPFVEKTEPEELPVKLRDNYNSFVAWMESPDNPLF